MKKLLKDDDLLWLAGFLILLVVIAASSPVFAGDEKKYIPKPPSTGENLQTVDAVSASSSVASPTLTANSGGGTSNANLYENTDSLGLAFGNAAPIPYGATPECYIPGKGLKRGQGWVFGLVQFSAVLERDEVCIEDMRAARAHAERMATLTVERIKAEAEASKAAREASDAATGRLIADCEWNQCVTK